MIAHSFQVVLLVYKIDNVLIQKENKGRNSETTFSDHKATKPKINKMRKILFCL